MIKEIVVDFYLNLMLGCLVWILSALAKFNPKKAGLFDGSFSCRRRSQFDSPFIFQEELI